MAVVKSTKEEGELSDHPGSDTFRYRESGGEPVCLFQRDLLTFYLKDFPKEQEEFITFLKRLFWDRDLIILEGFKSFSGFFKIWVLKEGEKEEEIREKYSGIEFFVKRGEEKKVLEVILNKLKEKRESEVFFYVNGKEILLKPFLQKILKEILFGFLKGLKGIPQEIFQLEVKIKK